MKYFLSVRAFVTADCFLHVISERIRLVTASAEGLPPSRYEPQARCIASCVPAMPSGVLATACPRGDCCVRTFHEVLPINSALYLCVDCWYTNVAIWNTRSIPCIQISNDFKFPTITFVVAMRLRFYLP